MFKKIIVVVSCLFGLVGCANESVKDVLYICKDRTQIRGSSFIRGLYFGASDSTVREGTKGFLVLSSGGIGRTFVTMSLSTGIVFMCEGDHLDFIKVGSGWKGKTDRGIKIGSTIEEVKKAYPEAVRAGGKLVWIIDDLKDPELTNPLLRWCTRYKTEFSFMFGKLSSIKVGKYGDYMYKGEFGKYPYDVFDK